MFFVHTPRLPGRSILLGSVALCVAIPGQAAEPVAANATVRSPEVVITATRTERELFDVPSSAAVVTQERMQRLPKRTIAEQLQDIPGVQVTDGGMGGGAKRVTIRGEAAARVLVLIDGMKLSEQKSMDGSMVLIGSENIERIEVIKGPASVLYGSEAIGGVVNIITKKGGKKPLQGTLTTTYDGAYDSLTPYASIYGSYEGFSYRLSGDYTNANDKRGASGTIDNTDYKQRNYSGYLDYAWNTSRVGFGYDHYGSNISIPSSKGDEDNSQVSIAMDLPKWRRDRLYGFYERDKIGTYLQKIKLTAFAQDTRKDFENNINVLATMPRGMTMAVASDIFTINRQRSYGSTLQTDWTFGDSHYVVAGIDFIRDTLKADETRRTFTTMRRNDRILPGFPRPAAGNGAYRYEAYQETLALFAQDEWNFHPDWTATLGTRATWVWSELEKSTSSALSTGKDSDSHLVGSAGIVYAGFEDWRLRANYSQGYRYPILQQLYIGTVHGSSNTTYPNPSLKPETSQNFELGARYDAGNFRSDFAVYYTTANDYIYRASTIRNGAKTYQFDNSNSADTYGAELELAYTYPAWNVTPYLSGAYMHRTFDRGSEGGGSTSNTGDPRWTGKIGLRHEYDFSSRLSLHTDAFLRMASSAREEDTFGTITRKGGWTTANLAVGARLGEEKKLSVDLNLNNIMDKRYVPAASSLEDPGFHAVLRVSVEF